MNPIQVVGIGLDGAAGLAPSVRCVVDRAAILAGSDRHLSYFPTHPAQRWPLSGLETRLKKHLQQPNPGIVVVLASGDPLFFGLGRQLLQSLPADDLTFHPHISSLQLAFSRIKLPWQDAALVSAHGRSLDSLEKVLKAGRSLIAILTDNANTPAAIADFVMSLRLPVAYRCWVCENLGGPEETVQMLSLAAVRQMTTASLNILILQRIELPVCLENLPLIGIPDALFLSFSDRPSLMTKREIRVQILAELALQSQQVVWDIGAGTGSVSVEIARLIPNGHVWAIERTTAGGELTRQNRDRFGIQNITVIPGEAPAALDGLPPPNRVFVGGSQGQLTAILDVCKRTLHPQGRIVVALATIDTLAEVTQWLNSHSDWQGQFQQISLLRSTAVGARSRWSPSNPVTLCCLTPATATG